MARIAMPIAQDVEDSEFGVPYARLRAAGHHVTLFGARAGEKVTGKRGTVRATTDSSAGELEPADFDALVIPGGYSPDHLRLNRQVVSFVKEFFDSGKLVAAICHGPQLLIEAGVVRGRTLTSWPSVRVDLENAGAAWVDRELVIDGNLITSRKPEDLEPFCGAVLAVLEAGDPDEEAAADDDEEDFEVDEDIDDEDFEDDDEDDEADDDATGS